MRMENQKKDPSPTQGVSEEEEEEEKEEQVLERELENEIQSFSNNPKLLSVINSLLERQRRDAMAATDEMLFEHIPDTHTVKDGIPIVNPAGFPNAAKQTVTTYELVDWDDVPESVRHHFRKRAKMLKTIDKKKTTCMLYLQADHLFHEKMGSEEATIEVMTRHVQRVNSIYKDIGN